MTHETIRVASVPADHPYVAHLSPPTATGEEAGVRPERELSPELPGTQEPAHVVRLPDPPVVGDDGSWRWWPPQMLEPSWLRAHADDFDVLHVHFGFESFTPAHLRDVVATAHALGKCVVVTVHDLRNPHIADERAQLDRLDALVPDADVVITLTNGAAAIIARRWERAALVVAHPHVVPLERLARHESPPPGRRRIGLHLKSLRPNVDAAGALDALALVATRSPDVEIIVTMHRAITDPADRGHDAAVVDRAESLAARGAITLVLHEPMDDDALFAHVGRLDVSVMANVWGTHSGWIEMCHDLGVRVVAPNIGCYAEQHAPVTYDLAAGEERIDPARLADAVAHALALPRPAPASPTDRRSERRGVAAQHAAAYRRALDLAQN